MIGRLAALILLSTLSQTSDVPPQTPMAVVELGDNLNLTCQIEDKGLIYWYKLKFGHMIQTVASGPHHKVSLQGQFANSRFTVTKVDVLTFLTIKNVSKEDEATYFCQSGETYTLNFTSGTLLAVKDSKNLKKSVYVKQIPETASVQVGNSVSLQCSLLFKSKDSRVQCPGEHSVYWFRAGSGESHPAILYTPSHSSDAREKKSCVYSLSKTIKDSSDNGTYYCAVVTCGEILFGEGTTVDTRTGEELYQLVIVFGILLACCLIVIVALIILRKQKPICEHCKGGASASNQPAWDRSAQDQSNNEDGEAMELNYAALNFSSRKRERWTSKRDTQPDCTYASMKAASDMLPP